MSILIGMILYSQAKNFKKENYTAHEMAETWNVFRLIFLVLTAGWLWIIHHYGVMDDFLFTISFGQIRVQENATFITTMVEVVKWVASVGTGVLGCITLVKKYIWKKSPQEDGDQDKETKNGQMES